MASAARSGTSPVVANSCSWLKACGSVKIEPVPVELDTSSVWLAFQVVTESAACSGSGSPAMAAPAIVKITTTHQNRRSASVGRVPFTVHRDYRPEQHGGGHARDPSGWAKRRYRAGSLSACRRGSALRGRSRWSSRGSRACRIL